MAISCSSRSCGVVGGQQVAGDLLADELVVRLVGVERVDDVVAVPPGVRVGDVPRRAGRLGVAGDVEPVPAPALAERGRGQQPVDHLLERVGRRVRRRTRRPPPASAAGRSGRTSPGGCSVGLSASPTGCRPFASSPARTKRSMSSCGQAASFDRRDGAGSSAAARPSAPCAACRTSTPSMFFGRRPGGGRVAAGQRLRPAGPGAPICTHFARSATTASGSRVLGGIFMSSSVYRTALISRLLLRVAGDDRRAAVAALEHAVAAVEVEPALELLGGGRVALVAVLDEHRPDLLLEELDAGGVGPGGGGWGVAAGAN